MIGILRHLCAHIGYVRPEDRPQDGDLTLPSRHRIRNLRPGGLRPSMLRLGHGGSLQYCIFTRERGRNIRFLSHLKARVAITNFPSLQL